MQYAPATRRVGQYRECFMDESQTPQPTATAMGDRHANLRRRGRSQHAFLGAYRMEALEPKMLLSALSFLGASLTVGVDPNNPSQDLVAVDGNAPVAVALIGNTLALTSTANGSLSLDFSYGNPMPDGGMSFDGTGGRSTLVIGNGAGSVSFPSEILYTATGVGGATVSFDGGSSTLSVANATCLSVGNWNPEGSANLICANSPSFDNLTVAGTTYLGSNMNINPGGSLTLNGAEVDSGVLNMPSYAGYPASVVVENGGLLVAQAITGGPNVTVQTGGTIVANSLNLSSLEIGSGTVSLNPGTTALDPTRTSVLGTLTMDTSNGQPEGLFDLANNAVIVQNTANDPLALATLNGLVGMNFENGSPTSGIYSSSVVADSSGSTVVGVVQNGDLATPKSTFAGQTVSANSILLADVTNGDLNMNGAVDDADSAILQAHVAQAGALWENGNLDYVEYTVASFGSNQTTSSRGQGITPDVSGPDGQGDPGGATSVYLTQFALGYATASTTNRCSTIYLYSSLPTLTQLNNAGTGALDTSTGCGDASDTFGSGTYSRTWTFAGLVPLDPNTEYYVLFSTNQSIREHTNNPYSGGNAYSILLSVTTNCTQFQATFTA